MKQKRNYQTPTAQTVAVRQEHHLLASTGEVQSGPSADFMKDPGFEEQ